MNPTTTNMENGDIEFEESLKVKGFRFGIRHIQVALLFFVAFNAFAVKTCTPMAVVAMTNSTTSSNPDVPTYDWDNNSVILSSFLWGYVATLVFSGQLAKNYGPKWFIFGAILLAGVVSTLVPLSAQYFGSAGLIVCTVIQGMALGFVFPSVHCVMSYWIPAEERTRLGSFIYAGTSFGSVFGSLTTGYISESRLGWPAAFYLLGGICFLWCILWGFFGANSPDVHPNISEAEKKYIMNSLGHHENSEVLETPWKAILTSMPFWALMVAGVGTVWISNMFIAENPTYMTNVLGLDIGTTSLFIAIYSSVAPIVTFGSGIIGDKLITTSIMSVTSVRRLFHILGTFVPAVLCLSLGFISKEQTALNVTIIAITLVMNGLIINSTIVNYIDLSPKFAGILLGMVDATSYGISIFAPLLVQFMVTDETDVSQWRTIFITTAAIVAGTSAFFVTFVSGEKQWWNEGKHSKDKNEEK